MLGFALPLLQMLLLTLEVAVFIQLAEMLCPDTTFLTSDTSLDSENPGTSRTPHQVDRTSTTQAQTFYSLDCQPELVKCLGKY
ncbi:unnamed protein product [Arctia plantaginis]|uniref:Uncharacterized protein n=1 Tax=Arctia plantaginis TaxID=874455 RepID=A0A8S0YSX4_ARCPL|nr:unnamed protein product [Arctia plantaginis]